MPGGDRFSGPPSDTATTIGMLRRRATEALDSAGIADPLRSVDWMLEEVLGCSRSHVISHAEETVPAAKAERFREMVRRRLCGEPLQYVVGWTEFYGLRLSVSPAVLIPRPETEILVDVGLELIRDRKDPAVLDVGTGSGCIAIAVASRRPDARISAVDVSDRALEVARRNADAVGVRVGFETGDIRVRGSGIGKGGSFDLVISNPPYVHPGEALELAREVVDFEPRAALFTGEDPLEFYRLLLAESPRMLRPGGCLAAEVHALRAGDVAALFEAAGLTDVKIKADLAGRQRVVWGRTRAT